MLTLPPSINSAKIATWQNANNEHVQGVTQKQAFDLVTGSLNALGDGIIIDVSDAASCRILFYGTFSIRAQFDASLDGVLWIPHYVTESNALLSYTVMPANITAASSYLAEVSGWRYLRVKCSTYTSGSAAVQVHRSTIVSGIFNAMPNSIGAVSATNRLNTSQLPDNLLVFTESASAGAAATLTLPSAGAGLYQFIGLLSITAYCTADNAGSATPVIATTTNLPSNPKFYFPTARAIGQSIAAQFSNTARMRSNTAATATTIVMPATPGVIWSAMASYTTGAAL